MCHITILLLKELYLGILIPLKFSQVEVTNIVISIIQKEIDKASLTKFGIFNTLWTL